MAEVTRSAVWWAARMVVTEHDRVATVPLDQLMEQLREVDRAINLLRDVLNQGLPDGERISTPTRASE